MHFERIGCPCATNEIEKLILYTLLSSGHNPLSRAELTRAASGSDEEPLDISYALDGLYAAGLIHVSGDFVMPTLALRRFEELQPNCI